ncbi:MAG: hypothetical protein JWO72_399 [Caulobacteraceae bacterium]|nr:hypothetical protein [Caulobacteraceae bacterium]
MKLPLLIAGAASGAMLATACPAAVPGPFGIRIGAPVSRLDGARRFKPGWYQVARPPLPDARFDKVAVEAFPATGVCVVQAVSPVIVSDPEGVGIRAEVDRLAQAFSADFGRPEKLNTCSSMICAPEFWASDLLAGERRYGYRWRTQGGAIPHVREVSVLAVARSATAFTYLVEYQGDALTACRTEEAALDVDGR